jgi:hypothetical protein
MLISYLSKKNPFLLCLNLIFAFYLFALGRDLIFARCESYLNSILCCTHTTGSSMPSSFLPYPCLLSPLTLAVLVSSTLMLPLYLSFESLPFLSTQLESCELPISPLISFHFLSPYKFCINSILCCVCICYYHHLVSHQSYLNTYPYACYLKISSLPPHFESGNLPIRPLDVSSSFPLVGPVLTPSFVVLISFVLMPIYLLSYILIHYHL